MTMLRVKPLVRPPLRVETPSGKPRKTKIQQANGRANFLWISTSCRRTSSPA